MFPCGLELLVEHTFNLHTRPKYNLKRSVIVTRIVLCLARLATLNYTLFFIGKRSTWVGAALTPNTLASCDSGITLHDDSKRRSFISYKLREQPSKGTVFALVNVESNALAGLSPQIRDKTRFTGGVAVAFCP